MKEFTALLSLPASLILLLTSALSTAQELEDKGSLLHVENNAHLKRELEIQQRLSWQAPSGMRKMSDDAGEKFFLQYWDFMEEPASDSEVLEYANSSDAPTLRAAIAPHIYHNRPHLHLSGRDLYVEAFTCPNNTVSCSSLGSDLCCPSSETCVSTSNNGVGCCPADETCGDTVGSCDASAGQISCPDSPAGGCCTSGASCFGSGCIYYGTETVIATQASSSTTAPSSTPASTSATTTVVAPVPAATSVSISGYTTTVTVTQSVSGGMTTIISATTVSVAPSVSSDSATSTTSTTQNDPGPAIRPTTISSSDTPVSVATVSTSASSALEGCPTGYYMCSAYYLGGCCRVDRSCHTTYCPPTDSTAVISGEPTVVVPYTSTTTGGAVAAADATGSQGSCANGWLSCAASASGGCCPSGYVCGVSTCTATVSGQQNTGKEAPSSGSIVKWAWSFLLLAAGSGLAMVLL